MASLRDAQMFPVLSPAQVAMAKRFASALVPRFAAGAPIVAIGAHDVPTWRVLGGSLGGFIRS